VISPWQCPLPFQENMTNKVAVYFDNDNSWVPIMFYSLKEAIMLYQQAKQSGMEMYIFPSEWNPSQFDLYCLKHIPQTSTSVFNHRAKQGVA
jgi:hypothetical protein